MTLSLLDTHLNKRSGDDQEIWRRGCAEQRSVSGQRPQEELAAATIDPSTMAMAGTRRLAAALARLSPFLFLILVVLEPRTSLAAWDGDATATAESDNDDDPCLLYLAQSTIPNGKAQGADNNTDTC